MRTEEEKKHNIFEDNTLIDPNRFLSIKNTREVAELLGIKYDRLLFSLGLLKEKPTRNRYYEFSIPKKNGGLRRISKPNAQILFFQQKLAKVFSLIYTPPQAAHGFITANKNTKGSYKKTIISNARQHKKKHIIVNIDLKDFFPSISAKRIYSLFRKPPFIFDKKVAALITEICVHDQHRNLPQGAATSPILSNMICYRLDKKLSYFAKKNKITYTRYADDMTFSTNKNEISEEILDNIKKIIEQEGFFINDKKIRTQHKNQRQEVTGLIVNKKVNVERKYIRKVRAMLNNWEKRGYNWCQAQLISKYRKRHICKQTPQFRVVLKGMINFIGDVRGKNTGNDEYNIYNKLYKRFLMLNNTSDKKSPLHKFSEKTEGINFSRSQRNSDFDLNSILSDIFENEESFSSTTEEKAKESETKTEKPNNDETTTKLEEVNKFEEFLNNLKTKEEKEAELKAPKESAEEETPPASSEKTVPSETKTEPAETKQTPPEKPVAPEEKKTEEKKTEEKSTEEKKEAEKALPKTDKELLEQFSVETTEDAKEVFLKMFDSNNTSIVSILSPVFAGRFGENVTKGILRHIKERLAKGTLKIRVHYVPGKIAGNFAYVNNTIYIPFKYVQGIDQFPVQVKIYHEMIHAIFNVGIEEDKELRQSVYKIVRHVRNLALSKSPAIEDERFVHFFGERAYSDSEFEEKDVEIKGAVKEFLAGFYSDTITEVGTKQAKVIFGIFQEIYQDKRKYSLASLFKKAIRLLLKKSSSVNAGNELELYTLRLLERYEEKIDPSSISFLPDFSEGELIN